MKFAEINRKFTETVAAWIAKGYTINTATMSGSQGEIAKIDLTNGNEIIRVDMRRIGKPFEKVDDRYYSFEGIEIAVGRITDKVQPNTHDTWSVAWTSHMEILSSEAFYEIGRQKRDGSKWYGTIEESKAQQDLSDKRYAARRINSTYTFSDKAKGVVLSFVKRQPGCKSKTRSDIGSVQKTIRVKTEGTHFIQYARYSVEVKNKEYTLR